MEQYNATYNVSDRPIEDFSMGEPNLPEARQKAPEWTFRINDLYNPNTDKLSMSMNIKILHGIGGNHEDI